MRRSWDHYDVSWLMKVCAIDLPEVHTFAAMGLLWALEKGYYADHV
jgi:hypothetical protein